jgi:OOP family OmpA-OmpF porin
MLYARLALATLFAFTMAQVAVAGGSTAPPAHKAYVAADVGSARSSGGFTGSESTESSTGYDLRAGYQFSRYFALEFGYTDLGGFDFEYRPACIPEASCDVDTHVEMKGPFVNAVGLFPLNDHWQLKARAGFFRLKISSSESGLGAPDVPPRFSNTNSGVSFGAAATYRVNDNIDLELSWTHFEQIDLGLTLSGGIGAFSQDTSTLAAVGLAWRF